jgi:hypothetical protein
MRNHKKLSKERVKELLAKGDADFRKSGLYRYVLKNQKAALSLEKILKVSSKIPGSLSSEVVAERKKGRG